MMRGDMEELSEFFHRLWHATQAPLQDGRVAAYRDLAFFRQRVESRFDRTILAVDDNRIAGFATWTCETLNSLFVGESWRGHGLGGELCKLAEEAMTLSSKGPLQLYCLFGNTAGRRFYEGRGWSVVAEVREATTINGGTCLVRAWRMEKHVSPSP